MSTHANTNTEQFVEIELDNYIVAKGTINGKYFHGIFTDKHYKNIVFDGIASIVSTNKYVPYDGTATNYEIDGVILQGKFDKFIFTGTKQYEDDRIYEGTFNLDGFLECNFGRIIYPNNEIDEGVFEDGELIMGSYFNPSKNQKFIGEFKNDVFIKGTIEQNNIPVYKGTMVYDETKEILLNGTVNGYIQKNKKWTGTIKNSVFNGKLEYLKTGTIKKGMFHNMHQLKSGQIIFKDGNVPKNGCFKYAQKIIGQWNEDGKFETKHGVIKYSKGNYKIGQFKNNLMIKGKLVMNSQTVYNGTFIGEMPFEGSAHNLYLGAYLFSGVFEKTKFKGCVENEADSRNGIFEYNAKQKILILS